MPVSTRGVQDDGAQRAPCITTAFPALPAPILDDPAGWWHAGCPFSRRRRQQPSDTTSSSRAKEEAMSFEIEFEEVPPRRRSLGLIVAGALALVGFLWLWRIVA